MTNNLDNTTVSRFPFYATIANSIIWLLIILDLGYTYYLIWYGPWASSIQSEKDAPDLTVYLQLFACLVFVSVMIVFCLTFLAFTQPVRYSRYALLNAFPLLLVFLYAVCSA